MFQDEHSWAKSRVTRRAAIATALAAGGAATGFAGSETRADAAQKPPTRKFDMKKSIKLWAFPYPDQMSLAQCLQLTRLRTRWIGCLGLEVKHERRGPFRDWLFTF